MSLQEQIYNNMQYLKLEKADRHKINFIPKNEEEKSHLRIMKELLSAKRKGDWRLVGEICGIRAKNAEVAFYRVYSKYHNKVVEALESVIESRKNLLNK